MPRKNRTHYSSALYHATSRGNNKNNIFLDDEDRKTFLCFLQDELLKNDAKLHAFCLMDNHFHLAIQVFDTPLCIIMRNLLSRYANYFNKKYNLTGHLFQARYYQILVEDDAYYFQLIRYIHLNPIRAFICENPSDYQWSSHNHYLGKKHLDWVDKSQLMSSLAKNSAHQQARYLEYIYQVDNVLPNEAFETGIEQTYILGSEGFIKSNGRGGMLMSVRLANFDLIKRLVCEKYEVPLNDLSSAKRYSKACEARAAICWIASKLNIFTISNSAKLLNCSKQAISKAISKYRFNYNNHMHELKDRIEKLINTTEIKDWGWVTY